MKIHYGGLEYTVTFADIIELDGKEKLGMISPHNQQIVISLQQKQSSGSVTLLHELIHMIHVSAGMKMTEGQIDGISYGLYQLFKSNPNLLEFLMKDEATKNKSKPRPVHRKSTGRKRKS